MMLCMRVLMAAGWFEGGMSRWMLWSRLGGVYGLRMICCKHVIAHAMSWRSSSLMVLYRCCWQGG